jgi:plastocyanin
MSKLFRLSILFVALAVVMGACGEGEEEDTDAQESANTVEAFDYYFDPTSLQLEPGAEATITLQNGGSVAHSFTVPDLDLEIEAQSGDSVDGTFAVPDVPGTLDFFCKFHPDEMSGTIAIGGADQPIEEDVDTEDDDDTDVDVDVEEEDDASGATTDEADY